MAQKEKEVSVAQAILVVLLLIVMFGVAFWFCIQDWLCDLACRRCGYVGGGKADLRHPCECTESTIPLVEACP
jgi:hypothetical protein